jgi:hypothetical protein
MKRPVISLVAVVILATACPTNGDVLVGRTVEFTNVYQGSTVRWVEAVVGDGVEVTNFNGFGFCIDASDSAPNTAVIRCFIDGSRDYTFGPSPNIIVARAISPEIPSFLSAAILDASQNWSAPSRLSFTNTSVSWDLGGLRAQTGDYIVFGVLAVPEPTVLAMLGSATVGLLTLVRRRRR